MKCYEVFVKIMNNGKKVGRQVVPVQADNVFQAMKEAEDSLDGVYGKDSFAHAVKIDELTQQEFIYLAVA